MLRFDVVIIVNLFDQINTKVKLFSLLVAICDMCQTFTAVGRVIDDLQDAMTPPSS